MNKFKFDSCSKKGPCQTSVTIVEFGGGGFNAKDFWTISYWWWKISFFATQEICQYMHNDLIYDFTNFLPVKA